MVVGRSDRPGQESGLANLVTVGRIALLFVGVWLLLQSTFGPLVGAAVVALAVVAADGLDGWVARVRGESSRFGAVFDIVGDRIVEAAYLVTFAYLGAIPLWVPLLVVSRGFLVDGLRGLALERGQTAFGATTMMVSRVGKALTSSRASRAIYGAAKALAFVVLPLALALGKADAPREIAVYQPTALATGLALAYVVAMFCLVRGLLVIHDARPLFRRSP
jgi:CDP-diacylglycerol--glycerol-3-phosphate 3-phosphatidyltransferase